MILKDVKIFSGRHCETTATGTLLKHLNIDLSEEMLFGLGEGLGFIYWHMKSMGFPFIGGRNKQDVLTQNIVRHLGLSVEYKETGSVPKAWQNVKEKIDEGNPVGLKLDCFHLEYFKEKVHFAGHYVALIGYDDTFAYVVDAAFPNGIAKTSLESLAKARCEKGAMSSKSLSYTISGKLTKYFDLAERVLAAVKANALGFLNPPIKNIGVDGILKFSKEIKSWFKISDDIKRDFDLTAMLMEDGGTGGSLFRNMYASFLREAGVLTKKEQLLGAHELFSASAKNWSAVARLIKQAGSSGDEGQLQQASVLLQEIYQLEKKAMELISEME